MDDERGSTSVEVHEAGFDGHVIIEVEGGEQRVRVSGTRPQDGAEVAKEVPASRDEELARLVGLVAGGDEGSAVPLLAHLGVLDPPLPD